MRASRSACLTLASVLVASRSMALEEEVVDDDEQAELDALCEAADAAAPAVGHDDGDGDAGDDDTALPAPALLPNKEPETKQLEREHRSDEAEAAPAIDDDDSFELRRVESKDDAAASEPESKPAGESEFGDDKEEKPKEVPVLLKTPAEGVLTTATTVTTATAATAAVTTPAATAPARTHGARRRTPLSSSGRARRQQRCGTLRLRLVITHSPCR